MSWSNTIKTSRYDHVRDMSGITPRADVVKMAPVRSFFQ
jgi:hypothetical protein